MPVREVARVNATRRSCVSPAPSGPFASAASESSGSITFGRTKTSSSSASAVILAPRSAATATHFSIAARAGPRGWPTSGRKTSLMGIGILLRRQNRSALVGTLDPRQARELRPVSRETGVDRSQGLAAICFYGLPCSRSEPPSDASGRTSWNDRRFCDPGPDLCGARQFRGSSKREADRYARRFGLPRRQTRPENQARREISIPRLFDAREAQGGV